MAYLVTGTVLAVSRVWLYVWLNDLYASHVVFPEIVPYVSWALAPEALLGAYTPGCNQADRRVASSESKMRTFLPLLLLAIAVADARVVAQRETAVGDFPAPPATFRELAQDTPLIVRVKIASSRAAAIQTIVGPVVFQISESRVLETYRGTAPTWIKVAQEGGTATYKGESLVTHGFGPRLEAGGEAILFLLAWKPYYVINYSGAGVYRVVLGRVEVPPAARRMSPFSDGGNSLPLGDFTALLSAVK